MNAHEGVVRCVERPLRSSLEESDGKGVARGRWVHLCKPIKLCLTSPFPILLLEVVMPSEEEDTTVLTDGTGLTSSPSGIQRCALTTMAYR
uniref:Uncharacterized protein n=1 Tax=Echinococcus granulosus TaxID=6210 RepID=U6FT68_ECHGR|nr:hypothetical protein EgrG_002058000 [Echinococcus granulosus]